MTDSPLDFSIKDGRHFYCSVRLSQIGWFSNLFHEPKMKAMDKYFAKHLRMNVKMSFTRNWGSWVMTLIFMLSRLIHSIFHL